MNTLSFSRICICVCLSVVGSMGISSSARAQSSGSQETACPNSVAISTASATSIELVPLTAGKRVVVCGILLSAAGATTVQFKTGTGSVCGTSTTNRTGAMSMITGVPLGNSSGSPLFRSAVGEALCVTNGLAVQLSGVISYGRF